MKKIYLIALLLSSFAGYSQLQLPYSVKLVNPKPVDFYYGPWATLAAAKAGVPLAVRYDGQTVMITGSGEYHWLAADLTDSGLIVKGGAGGATPTLQQALTAGSVLTGAANITGTYDVTFNNNAWTFGNRLAGTVGSKSFVSGEDNIASGIGAHAEGYAGESMASFSHTEGISTNATGTASHAEGNNSTASGDYSHAESGSTASGQYSHSEGLNTTASGVGSHVEGNFSTASGINSHAEGSRTIASSDATHTGGIGFGATKEVIASGSAAFNHSTTTTAQTAGHGALANRSAILGGQDHNIESGNTGAVVLGGDGIKLTSTTYIDHVAVPNLAIFSTPTAGAASTDDVLVWDATSKKVKKVTQASLGGGGGGGSGTVNSGTLDQLAYYAGTGTAVSGTNALPSVTTATTQTAGDNSTKIATTAYVNKATEKIYNVETYGALHDYKIVSDANVTSGTATLTSATAAFVTGDTGKTIRVFGAGVAGADLITTITYVNATTVTLAVNASTTIAAKQIEWGSDDTQEIQAAIDAAFAAGGGTVYFQNGRYLIAGALQTSVNSVNPNCQIYIPLTPSATQLLSVNLLGETSVPLPWGPFASIGQPTTGVQLISVIVGSGTLPSVIGTPFVFDGFVDTNRTFVEIENITIRVKTLTGTTHIAPLMSAFNVGNLSAKQLKNCYAYTESNPTVSVEPTTECYGFYLSSNSHSDNHSYYENLTASGYYYGFRIEEHDTWTRLNAYNCLRAVGIEGNGAGHPIFGTGVIGNWWCKYGVVFLASTDVEFKYTAERWPGSFGSRWFDGVADVYYPSSVAVNGEITAGVDIAGGASGTPIQSGTNTGNLKLAHVNSGITYGSGSIINLESTGNESIKVTGSGNDLISIVGTGAGSSRSGFSARATNTGGQVTNYMLNDRAVFTSYGGQLYGGSANVSGNLFGVSRADKYIIFADGASNLGMAIGTLGAQPLYIGTNNTERLRINSTGAFGVSGANYGTSGQVLTSAGSGSAPTWAAPFTLTTTGTSGAATYTSGTLNIPQYSGGGGGGDMLLGTSQTNTAAKTFNDATLFHRNVANTFSGQFTNTITAARTWTLPDEAGTVLLGTGAINQIGYFTSTNSQAGESAFTYNSTSNTLTVDNIVANGSTHAAITATTSNITLDATHYTIIVDDASGVKTVTLPAAISGWKRIYVIKKFSASNSVVIDANGSETIDRELTKTLTTQWQTMTIQSDGTEWFVVSDVNAPPKTFMVAASDEATVITAGTAKVTFRIPHAMTLTGIRASLTTAQASGSIITVDVNESGTSILSTKLTLDNTETTTKTAATSAVLSDVSLADDAVITVDIDVVGAATVAAGLKVTLIGY